MAIAERGRGVAQRALGLLVQSIGRGVMFHEYGIAPGWDCVVPCRRMAHVGPQSGQHATTVPRTSRFKSHGDPMAEFVHFAEPAKFLVLADPEEVMSIHPDALFFVDASAGRVWLRFHPDHSSRVQLMCDEQGLGSFHTVGAAASAAAKGETASPVLNALPPGTIPDAIEKWERGPG